MSGEHDNPEPGGKQARNGRREQRPSFQFYPQDFLASDSVAQMTPEEVGLYILLLCRAWVGPGLPTDIARVARLVGVPEERFRALWCGPLGTCFEERDGRLVNPRMERERDIAASLSEKRALAGSRGGKAKAEVQQPDSNPSGVATGLLEQSASKGDGMGRDGTGRDGSLSSERGTGGGDPTRKAPPHADDGPWPVVGTSLLDVPDVLRPDLTAWAAHRREKGSPLTRSSIAKLVAAGVVDPVAFHRRVEASIESGTTVLLPDKGAATNGRPRPHSSQDAFRANLADLERHIAEAFPDAPTPRLTQ